MMTAAAVSAVHAFPGWVLTPWGWAGKAISGVVGDAWTTIMLSIFQLALRLLEGELWLLRSVTTPDVSKTGPLQGVIPIALAISAGMAGIMMFSQIALAVWRRDGGGLTHILYGTFQWGLVYVGTWGVCAGLIEAAKQLENAIISVGFDVPNMNYLTSDKIFNVGPGQSTFEALTRDVTDAGAATMYGILSLLLFLPAGLLGMGVALTRMGALMILTVTLPISASGLINEFGARIFWRSARWFLAAVLIAPNVALLFVIGVQISGRISVGDGKDFLGSLGTAVVAGFIMLMAAYCPVALYRIFGWVEPGTAANSQMRSLMQDAKGGFGGLFGGGGSGGGGDDKASQTSRSAGGGHKAAGEDDADGATGHRFGMAGAAAGKVAGAAKGAASAAAGKMAGSSHGSVSAMGRGAQSAGAAASGAASGAASKLGAMASSPAGQKAGAFLSRGQSMAGSAAAGARNLQADVLGGSGIGDRLDNYAGAPTPGGPQSTSRPRNPHGSVDLGAQLRNDSQHQPGGHDHGHGDGAGPGQQSLFDVAADAAGDAAGGAE